MTVDNTVAVTPDNITFKINVNSIITNSIITVGSITENINIIVKNITFDNIKACTYLSTTFNV